MSLHMLEAIGSDRYLSPDESAAIAAHPHGEEAWSLYQSHFGGYCETRLDPVFNRLRLPVKTAGRVSHDTAPVLVVGTGPSLTPALPELTRLRRQLRIVTSPRGAAALKAARILPDLVLVEHRTALDAHHTARFSRDGVEHPLADVPLVAVEWRTPASLVEGVAATVFVPDDVPSWGLWPATLGAMALGWGASRIGLLGVDLGAASRPDPTFEPLVRLLGLLATIAGDRPLLDCGPGGAPKPGWTGARLADLASNVPCGGPLSIDGRPASSTRERQNAATAALAVLKGPRARARDILQLASQRGGAATQALERAALELLSWHQDAALRARLQEDLGLSLLPRLWRRGLSPYLGESIWRPVLLATHELVFQADRLAAEVGA